MFWTKTFESKISTGRVIKSSEDAIERLLLLEHLRLKKRLNDDEVESEKKTFLSEFDDLENPDITLYIENGNLDKKHASIHHRHGIYF